MADDKTYTEAEHIAILSDRLTKETADLTTERDQLVADKSELENKLDVLESAKTAAEQSVVTAQEALESFKTEVNEEREAATRKGDRVAKLREGASHLGEDFFTDEARLARITAMADEDFAGYLADLAVTKPVGTPALTLAPRVTAMAGDPVVGADGVSAARGFLLRNHIKMEG